MKVSIIGAGRLGATLAYTLTLKDIVREITLIDINKDLSKGEMLDISHGISLTGHTRVKTADYESVKDADIVVITAGIPRKPGESRLDLNKKNVHILKQIVGNIIKYNTNCILFVVSNPVDIMTYVAYKTSGFERKKVFGMGTMLDTTRLRSAVGSYFDLNPEDVDIMFLGEHGDSMTPIFSLASINSIPLRDIPGYNMEKLKELAERSSTCAAEVIALKGGTIFAPAVVMSEIIESMVKDRRQIMPLSVYLEDYYGINGIYTGVPAILSKDGIEKVIKPELTEEEIKGLNKSASIIKNAIDDLRKEGLIE
jgi:L-lactate dehydrogenase